MKRLKRKELSSFPTIYSNGKLGNWKMMIKPLRGYVLIEIEKSENKTDSGLYLPENSQEKPAKGKIIEVGEPTHEMIKLVSEIYPDSKEPDGIGWLLINFHKDQVVYFKKWAGTEIKENGKEYVFVRFEDLLGVVDE